ncbi:MAG: crotonobetainyl-CoA--carnitine CoA-transferase, partial [Candidatus Omnitrophica bacterium]|nr:crotonobetainyl-CoA--carnitine CoA-transferase [Candidatus Omnitrophota bacterium]
MDRTDVKTSSSQEIEIRRQIVDIFRQCPIPDHEILENLPLFIKRRDLMRILFIHEMYERILTVPGIIMEFGVRWGKNMALYESFRGMYEPYNHIRKIVGFDTFEGFPTVNNKDGKSSVVHVGQYSVTKGYEKYLEEVL